MENVTFFFRLCYALKILLEFLESDVKKYASYIMFKSVDPQIYDKWSY